MIVRSDVIRAGFGEFRFDSYTLDDLNNTLDALKSSAALRGEIDYQEMISMARESLGETPSYMRGPSKFDMQTIRNYFLLRSVLQDEYGYVERALSLGAEANKQCLVGGRRWYPLVAAAYQAGKDIVELLVRRGADVNIQQLSGESALAVAVSENRYKVSRFLLENGANPNVMAHGGLTPLSLVDDARMVELLLQHGANPNIPDDDGDLPIIARIDNGDVDSIRLLVSAGTDLNHRNLSGESVRNHAMRAGIRL